MATDDVRRLWIDTSRAVLAFAHDPEVEARWMDPSSLPGMAVGAVTGHLLHSGVLMVEDSLDVADVPQDAPVTAAQLLSWVPADAGDAIHENVRSMSLAQIEQGRDDLLRRASEALDRVAARVEAAPLELRTAFAPVPFLAVPMTLDELLKSRILELVVHLDDLVSSVGVNDLPVPSAAIAVACHVGMDINIHRYGGAPVARALFRRDRNALDALRTF